MEKQKKIGLIDVDYRQGNPFPNIALMKISAYHKNKCDSVEWYSPFEHYDIVYKSKVFSFSSDWGDYINADVVKQGGSGYAIKLVNGREVYDKSKDQDLPTEIETQFPDYSLYNIKDTAYGFLTRGCPRGCEFCHVKSKEGLKSYKVADLNQFWNGQKKIVLCDPNILAYKDCDDLLLQLAGSKANVNFNQGLDARLLTERKCELLNQIKIKEIHFAWDCYDDKDLILPRLEMFRKLVKKCKTDHNAIVYILVNFDTTFEQDLERVYTLRKLGYWGYIMIYDKANCNKKYIRLQRWVNNRFIFANCERFEDYKD